MVHCWKSGLTVRQGDKFINRYALVIKNKYPPNIKLEKVNIGFNSSMTLDDYNILLWDFDNDMLDISATDKSSLVVRVPTLCGWHRLGLGIDCFLDLRHEIPPRMRKGTTFWAKSATVVTEYDLFGKRHTESISGLFRQEYLPQVFKKEDITIDINRILDHKRLPNEFLQFQYAEFKSEEGEEKIRIFCVDKKYVEVVYSNPVRRMKIRSSKPISADYDLIRILVTKEAVVIDSDLYEEKVHYKNEEFRKAEEYFKEGNEFLEKGDYDNAIVSKLNYVHY